MKQKAFWILTVLALLAVNTLAAVLYAGVPALDRGTGFICLSPFIDIVWWGGVILLTGVPALVLGLRSRPALPHFPRQIAPAAAFLALQGVLSLAILVLGPLFLDRFPWIAQIPFWGYAAGLAAFYLAAGAVWTGKRGGALGWTLLWCAAFTALFLVLGLSELEYIVQREAEYLRLEPDANLIPASAGLVMNSTRGAVLGRLDLPACVLIECYYEEGEALGRWTITTLTCLLPGVCLVVGSVFGYFIRKRRERP